MSDTVTAESFLDPRPELVKPLSLTVDGGLDPARARHLLVAEDKLAVRLRFTGSFTGTFNGIAGAGQPVDFIAFDIQHVGPDRITEDWHLEDNLTFLLQAGLATVARA